MPPPHTNIHKIHFLALLLALLHQMQPQKEFLGFSCLTSGCNLVLLNSKDPTVLLAPKQRTSPFIIWSLMNDLVRQ